MFEKRVAKPQALLAYGFEEKDGIYELIKSLRDGDFILSVKVGEKVSFELLDGETGELYPALFAASRQGAFVNQLRQEVLDVLEDIRDKCFTAPSKFSAQTERLLAAIFQKYGTKLAYPWEKMRSETASPAGVLRHAESQKWYGLVMTMDAEKITPQKAGKTQILNLKHDRVAELIKEEGIYPAYHMNKKYWLSLMLDDSLADERILALLERSFELTKK